jgi:hypothetical protein
LLKCSNFLGIASTQLNFGSVVLGGIFLGELLHCGYDLFSRNPICWGGRLIFREVGRVETLLEKTCFVLRSVRYDFELLVVSETDGSVDFVLHDIDNVFGHQGETNGWAGVHK